MAYLSLYRKYRPRTFADILGQRTVKQTLQNALRAERISHAYLFTGPRGTGKTTTARVLAAALDCEKGPAPEPCGVCDTCVEMREDRSLDLLEIDAASQRSIEDIRNLRERVHVMPSRARYKVYIIDEVHMVTGPAFNAFLKTLEEPPRHVVFVMATTEPQRIPATILSRCQRFDFRRLLASEIGAQLAKVAAEEKLKVKPDAIEALAQMADGSMRDGLSLLEQVVAYAEKDVSADDVYAVAGASDPQVPLEFLRATAEGDLAGLLQLLDRAVQEGKDLRHLAALWREYLRHALLTQTCKEAQQLIPLGAAALEQLGEHSKKMSQRQLLAALDVLGEAESELRWSSQQRLLLEVAAVKMCVAPQPEQAPPAAAPAHQPAPAGRAQPAAQAAPAFEPGEFTLESVQNGWPAVIERIKSKKSKKELRVAAFLLESRPIALEGDLLTLEFALAFHRDSMDSPESKPVLAAVIKELWGKVVRIECRLGARQPKGQAGGDGEEDAVKRAMGVFPGSKPVEKKPDGRAR